MTAAISAFLAMATNLWKAMGYALPSIPESSRSALQTRISDGDARWTLALLLAAWSLSHKEEPGADEIQAVIRQAEASDLMPQIEIIRGMPGFMMFINSVRQAKEEKELVAPASYFAGAVTELDYFRSQALHGWLRSKRFLEVGRTLVDRFPVPESGRPPVWQSPPDSPPEARKPTRGQRFDRADFTARPKLNQPPNVPAAPSATTPKLSEEDVTRAHLHALGWNADSIAKALRGPQRG